MDRRPTDERPAAVGRSLEVNAPAIVLTARPGDHGAITAHQRLVLHRPHGIVVEAPLLPPGATTVDALADDSPPGARGGPDLRIEKEGGGRFSLARPGRADKQDRIPAGVPAAIGLRPLDHDPRLAPPRCIVPRDPDRDILLPLVGAAEPGSNELAGPRLDDRAGMAGRGWPAAWDDKLAQLHRRRAEAGVGRGERLIAAGGLPDHHRQHRRQRQGANR